MSSNNKTIALVLGSGAPNATLMAGTLVALIEAGVRFDIVSTSGAGAIVGLLYAAPKNGDPRKALKQLVNIGVSDPIYSLFPVNFKVFHKPGLIADHWRRLLRSNPFVSAINEWVGTDALHRLTVDFLALCNAALCPTDVGPFSTGLCAHPPFVGELIDFSALSDIAPQFYINAYNLSRRKMVCWDKSQVNTEHLQAALSFPFIYPPFELDGEFYIEGAAVDTLNFRRLFEDHPYIDTTVVFDVLGSDNLLQPPRNLYDAWVQSIITPLIEIARDDLRLFELIHNKDENGNPRTKVLRVPYDKFISSRERPLELDWSYSNLESLYEAGYKAGQHLCAHHCQELGILVGTHLCSDDAVGDDGLDL